MRRQASLGYNATKKKKKTLHARCHELYSCHNSGFLWICHSLRNFFFDIIRLFIAKHICGKGIKMDTEESRVWPLGAWAG